jgi:hypothetical protein
MHIRKIQKINVFIILKLTSIIFATNIIIAMIDIILIRFI